MAEVSQTSRSSTRQKNILKLHNEMIIKLGDMFSPNQWNSICDQVKEMEYVSARDMDGAHTYSMVDLCRALMRNGIIKHGEYSDLREILVTCDVEAGVIIGEYSERIFREREGSSPAKQPRSGDPGQQQSTEVYPDLKPLIEKARARIKNEKEEKKFYPTKGFCDAKEKLLKNKVVVIKGNTGDGKTAIAVQLLHWLSEEQQAGQPLQLHEIRDLRLLSPNLKLITFIDDIFGEKEVSKTDVGEWNKRVSHVKTCFLDEQTETNFLVITVRNEVFNSLEKRSMGTIFTKDHLIDLSSHTYKIAKEKEELLEMYKPENFSWADEEKTQVTTYAPNIGFPQCCQIFYNSKELQKERAKFFEKPLNFLNEALSRLQECSALLYLFLNDGEIKVKDLDPNSKKVNETLLEEAININLIDRETDNRQLTCEKKLGFVKESLEKLVGFLVVKETYLSGEDVYRFNHNSVRVAVALLYGQATPIGFIQNCPSESLSYLTTSKTATNMIVISSDYYTEMCERLLREFECMEDYGDTCVGSLDVWNDPVFVKRFDRLLNDRKVDKPDVLNKACRSGAEECALYLLSEGVKPNKDTALPLVSRHWNDSNRQVCLLREMVVYLNDETKLDVLNEAYHSGAEECVLYLLSEGVKPNKDTVFSVVRGESVKVFCKLLTYDITPTARYYNNYNVLHWACLLAREKMVTLLCDTYPHLVHDTDNDGHTPLYAAARGGNCFVFQTVERCVLNSLYRDEDQQHQCESVDDRVIHRNCLCAQYMAQLVDGEGMTVLHWSCESQWGSDVCLYVCQSYPTLTTAVSKDGKHCLHFSAGSRWSNVDRFTDCEAYVKQYQESTGGHYDIKTILDNKGESVLDKAKETAKKWAMILGTENNPLLDYLIIEFGKQK